MLSHSASEPHRGLPPGVNLSRQVLTFTFLAYYHGSMTATPATVAANRTARLAAEATRPVFTSTREGQAAREREALLREVDDFAGEDFCLICGRATDHRGEHSDEQLLAWAASPRGRWLLRA